jgi:hypothetical protein
MGQDWRVRAEPGLSMREFSLASMAPAPVQRGLRHAVVQQRYRGRCFGLLTRCSSTGSCSAVSPTAAATRQHLQGSVDAG